MTHRRRPLTVLAGTGLSPWPAIHGFGRLDEGMDSGPSPTMTSSHRSVFAIKMNADPVCHCQHGLVLYQAVMTLTRSLPSWPGACFGRPGHLRFSGRWADGRDARSGRPAMTAPGGSKSRQAGIIPSGDDIDTLVAVMAGRLLRASRPSALQWPVGGWPGRHKQAPGHDGAWRVEVKAGWYYTRR